MNVKKKEIVENVENKKHNFNVGLIIKIIEIIVRDYVLEWVYNIKVNVKKNNNVVIRLMKFVVLIIKFIRMNVKL